MMNDLIINFLIIVFGIIIGLFIGQLLGKLKREKEKSILEGQNSLLKSSLINSENSVLETEKKINSIQQEKENLLTINSHQAADLKNLQLKLNENKKEINKIQEKFTLEFENLANRILDEKSTKFTNQNKENLNIILNPLKEKIKGFEDKVDKTHKESIDYHAALRQQIIGLKEMNLQMSKETINLTKALKGDNKTQGNWGELVLERVLEKSGLEKDREYFVQQSFTNDEGKRVLPDVVIHLPDNKKMIVDSKVSLTAYEQFVNCDDESEKSLFLKDHINSLKRHIEQLSEKNMRIYIKLNLRILCYYSSQ